MSDKSKIVQGTVTGNICITNGVHRRTTTAAHAAVLAFAGIAEGQVGAGGAYAGPIPLDQATLDAIRPV